MKVRNVARWSALAGMAAALLGAAPARSATSTAPEVRLPACSPGAASTRAPTGPAGPGTPGACRAVGRVLESGVQPARPVRRTFTPSGYHHLGANTAGEWGGVSGRMSVVDGSVRPNSYDFVAGRFMAKRNMGGGRIAWLEAGWAETGWAGAGRQHVYTFNTNTKTWQFYDQYALRPGDKVWVDLHTDAEGAWSAWLWWNNRWNLLTAQKLPIGTSAFIEQYVEVHVDPSRAAQIGVPTVTVDNVQLRPPGGGPARFWRDDVPTLTGVGPGQQQRNGGFCLNWLTRYDTWTAGDCAGDGDGQNGGLLGTRTPPGQALGNAVAAGAALVQNLRPGGAPRPTVIRQRPTRDRGRN
ncbi:hypothetical protein ACWKSP_05485 [Micromonosporaceae bacterium Da 78-11]